MKHNDDARARFGWVVLGLAVGCNSMHRVGEFPEAGGTSGLGATSVGGTAVAGGQGVTATTTNTQAQASEIGANASPNSMGGQSGANASPEPPPPVLPDFGNDCVLTRYTWDPAVLEYRYKYTRVSYDSATRVVKRESYDPSVASYSMQQTVEYDPSGHIVYYEDPLYQQTTSQCSYDERGNLVTWESTLDRGFGEEPHVVSGTLTHTYDTDGHLVSSALQNTDHVDDAYAYAADSRNQCIKTVQLSRTITRQFSNDQLVRTETTYDYGPACDEASVMQYDTLGRPSVLTHFNGETPDMVCDEGSDGMPVYQESYVYAPDGTVTVTSFTSAIPNYEANDQIEYQGTMIPALRSEIHAPPPCAQLLAQIPRAQSVGCAFPLMSPTFAVSALIQGEGDCAPTW